jgi:parvulin-like peptidyl-prolyl isomerase
MLFLVLRVDKGVPVRLVLYTIGIIYLFLDLFVFDGPLRRKLREENPQSPERIASAKAKGVVARVFYQPILLSQVDRRVEERLWKEGRKLDGLGKEERKLLRMAALNDLIDLHLLGRIKVQFNLSDDSVSREAVDAAVASFVKGFENTREMEERMAEQGWTMEELRLRLAAKIQQQMYLDQLIEVGVSDEEARTFYDSHQAELGQPDRMRVRHIFLAHLENESADAKSALEEAQGKLERKEAGFAELAAARSEDERSKDAGGELGWMHTGRLPADFAESVSALPLHQPRVVRTKLGWHLVEVMEKLPGEPRSFDETKSEIVIALEAMKREEGLRAYRRQLRNLEKQKVEVFRDVLDE